MKVTLSFNHGPRDDSRDNEIFTFFPYRDALEIIGSFNYFLSFKVSTFITEHTVALWSQNAGFTILLWLFQYSLTRSYFNYSHLKLPLCSNCPWLGLPSFTRTDRQTSRWGFVPSVWLRLLLRHHQQMGTIDFRGTIHIQWSKYQRILQSQSQAIAQ